MLYTGVETSSQNTAGAGNTTTNGTYLAQSFNTAVGQTAIGYVAIELLSTTSLGANLSPTTVSIFANSAGAPSGSALISATVTAEYADFGALNLVVPTPVTGLTASTTYWIVVAAAGNATFNYFWNRSNQTSGASTSPNGTTWTAQAYGFLYQVWDQTAIGPRVATWEDGGVRWTWTGHDVNDKLQSYAEYTNGQTTAGYLQSGRTLQYSGTALVEVV